MKKFVYVVGKSDREGRTWFYEDVYANTISSGRQVVYDRYRENKPEFVKHVGTEQPNLNSENIDEIVASCLEEIRAEREMSKSEVARRTSFSRATIIRIEQGKASVRIAQLISILRIYGVDLVSFIIRVSQK